MKNANDTQFGSAEILLTVALVAVLAAVVVPGFMQMVSRAFVVLLALGGVLAVAARMADSGSDVLLFFQRWRLTATSIRKPSGEAARPR